MTVAAAARVVTGAAVHTPGWASYVDGRLTGVGAGRPGEVDHDYGDATLVPGFVDQHVHGGGGGSFTDHDAESVLRAVDTHRRHGTTTTMASLVTAAPEDLLESVSMLGGLVRDGVLAGIHLEGPWISPQRCGAHDPNWLREPGSAEIGRLLAAADGSLAMVTLAPELPGAQKAIRRFVEAGVLVAVGHTNCTFKEATRAINAGARIATHLFNGIRPIHHREPGPILALLDDARVTVELIADGVHLHPALYHYVSAAAGPDRVALVTDAMAAAGLGDGQYALGPMSVEVHDGVARIAGTHTIAGSTTTMDHLFRNAVSSWDQEPAPDGVSPPSDAALLSAVRQTSVNPARTLRRDDIGCLESGRRADLVVLDPVLRVTRVLIGGEPVGDAGVDLTAAAR